MAVQRWSRQRIIASKAIDGMAKNSGYDNGVANCEAAGFKWLADLFRVASGKLDHPPIRIPRVASSQATVRRSHECEDGHKRHVRYAAAQTI
jgi:hypothetical protein